MKINNKNIQLYGNWIKFKNELIGNLQYCANRILISEEAVHKYKLRSSYRINEIELIIDRLSA